jgi:adenosylcobinamide-phosphate synthase
VSSDPGRATLPRKPGAWPLAGGLIAGAVADALLGDPNRAHPVALCGSVARVLEDRLYAPSRARGSIFTACGLALATGPAIAGTMACRHQPAARLACTTACTWTVIAPRSLAAAAERIRQALMADDTRAARHMLPALCGRDPDHLNNAQIAMAVIESVAENTNDAIVAPLLWGALADNPGMVAYRAVNTLDAMVGYRNARYEHFGFASARLDDAANWAPARLTALLTAACAPVVDGQPSLAWRTARCYGPLHPSPNAGWCEAAFAGALGLRLGGPIRYRWRTENRPVLGDGRSPEPTDIRRAIRLSRAVTAAATGAAAAVAMTLDAPAGRRGKLARSLSPQLFAVVTQRGGGRRGRRRGGESGR